MTKGTDKVWAHPLLWIMTVTVIAFNIAAAMSHSARLTYVSLALTGMAALVGISSGIWLGLMKTKARRHS
jgi:hypothetical protein